MLYIQTLYKITEYINKNKNILNLYTFNVLSKFIITL
jgi:hypothetical protein